MRRAGLRGRVIASRTAAAISVIVSCEKAERVASPVAGAIRRKVSTNSAERKARSSSSSFCSARSAWVACQMSRMTGVSINIW